ncbi:hypothetical protein GCM10009839_25450 [Catenulispora yoronensis]|uniref:Thioredoxin domain-containing protein n=1 Tax=Catenulispora yoronensis TaxID=450799 RepID=A0ABN2U1X8_9ACTN
MVGVLAAAVAVLAVVTGLNLVLLFAVIRKLRTTEARLGTAPVATLPKQGSEIGSFLIAAEDDSMISDASIGDGMTVACVMPGCAPCKTQIAAFRERPRSAPEKTVFFVFGGQGEPETEELVTSLAGLGQVAVTQTAGAVGVALDDVTSFPTLLRTEGGRIAAVGRTWEDIGAVAVATVR